MELQDIKTAVDEYHSETKNSVEILKKENKTLSAEVGELMKQANRPGMLDSIRAQTDPETKPETWINTQTKQAVPVLTHDKRLSRPGHTPSMGRILRGIALGGRADDADELAEERKSLSINPDPSGGYTVSGALSDEWIDVLRAQMVLSQAGARTVPMDTAELRIAKVTADPEVHWHAENASLESSDPTFGAVNLSAKTIVCLVRLSLELSQDSANIEEILERTITSAMASEIDRAGLNGVTEDAALAPGGVLNLTDRNSVTSIGTPTNWDFLIDGMYELSADNVALSDIGALIAHPKLWKNQAKLKTGITNDETTLVAPVDAQNIPKLWTTSAPEGTGIIADWRDLVFGVRNNITVRVLSESFMGSNLQMAVLAYSRVDFASVRDQSFCTLEGLTYT